MQHQRTRSHLPSWRGTCVIDGEFRRARWRECRVIAVSPDGMGLTLRHEEPADLVERTMQVEFPANSCSLKVYLDGRVKSAVAVGTGVVRVALEFEGLSRSEKALATVLNALTETCEPVDPGVSSEIPSRSISTPRWSTEREPPRLEVLTGAS
jgi:hypothetical protein